MLQTINNRLVFVVDLPVDPKTLIPITWSTAEEEPYAKALSAAIWNELITEPGKYGIHLIQDGDKKRYSIYAIKE
jgi:hypothetical protein